MKKRKKILLSSFNNKQGRRYKEVTMNQQKNKTKQNKIKNFSLVDTMKEKTTDQRR